MRDRDLLMERMTRAILLTFALFGLALLVLSSPAQAGHGRGRGHDHHAVPHHARHHDHGYRHGPSHHGRYVGHGHRAPVVVDGYPHRHRFVVPRRILVAGAGDYRPYFRGTVYNAGHRHHHDVYDFPVWVDGVLVWRPHIYCDGGLFVGGDVVLGRGHFSVRIGF